MASPTPTAKKTNRNSPGRGRKKELAREASIERILDAAEQLFAEFGYHGVTLKAVAKKIGVSPNLVHYHFSGKESIFEAIWARKAPISSEGRLVALHRYAEEAGDAVTVEGALAVWINSDLDAHIEQEEYWSAFGRIAAQANSAGGWGSEKMSTYFDPVVLALVAILKKAMPGSTDERIFWAFHFASGSMTHNLARTGRLDAVSGGLCSSNDFRSIREHMVSFMAAGFRAICQPPPDAKG